MDDYIVNFSSVVSCSVVIQAESMDDAERRFKDGDYQGQAEITNGGLFIDLTESVCSDMPVFIEPPHGGVPDFLMV